MGTLDKQLPLKVYLSDISPHSQAILEFFIGSVGGKSFSLVKTSADAEVYITDFDFPGSKDHWEAEHAISAKPCIALSLEDPGNELVEWVKKPITAQALTEAAKKIASNISTASTKTSTKKNTEQSTQTQTTQANTFKRPPPLPRSSSPMKTPFRKTSSVTPPPIHKPAPSFKQGNSSVAIVKEVREQDDVAVAIKPEIKQTRSTASISAKEETKVKAVKTQLDATESETLIDTATETNIEKAHNSEISSEINSDDNHAEPEATQKSTIDHAAIAKKRWNTLCGTHGNLSHTSLKENEDLNYNSENHFQGTLIAALRLAKQTRQVVQIKFEPHQFYICHDEFMVFSPLDPKSDEYDKLCFTKVKPGQVNLHILSGPESSEIRKRMQTHENSTYDLESFIWTSCLLSSKGRVPSSLDCDSQYLLKHWPNFTRIENFPFAMKIAARWQKRPYKISDIAREMDIPIRYVVAFYNGVIGLSLLETDASKIQQKSEIKPTKNKGLIARLFGRLTRSEAKN